MLEAIARQYLILRVHALHFCFAIHRHAKLCIIKSAMQT